MVKPSSSSQMHVSRMNSWIQTLIHCPKLKMRNHKRTSPKAKICWLTVLGFPENSVTTRKSGMEFSKLKQLRVLTILLGTMLSLKHQHQHQVRKCFPMAFETTNQTVHSGTLHTPSPSESHSRTIRGANKAHAPTEGSLESASHSFTLGLVLDPY